MKQRILAALLALMVGTTGSAFAQMGERPSSDKAYTIESFDADGFIRVTNPNGGSMLSYSPDSGITLLEVESDGYTYAFKDLNRNGALDTYEDWRLTAQKRAAALTEALSLECMAGLLVESFQVRYSDNGEISQDVEKIILDEKIRTLLIRNHDTLENRVTWYNHLQALVEKNDPFGIPVTLSTDPKNGSAGSAEDAVASTTSASGWPSSIGLAATFDPDFALQMGQVIAKEYRALGISIGLSPQIDLATEPRWNRFSGTFGEDMDLASDFAAALVSGMQSSWNGIGADAEDLGWGKESVTAMVKHFPGDGSAEAGRESHNNYGKYNVYPGGNMAEHLKVFEAVFHLSSKTGTAAAVMPSYSMAYDEFGSIGEAMGSGFSAYKLQTLLREQMGFKGLICADWEITENKPWGIETQGYLERYVTAMKNGLNQFGGLYFSSGVADAYKAGALMLTETPMAYPSFHFYAGQTKGGTDGESIMKELYAESARLVLENHFTLGLFENPYVSSQESAVVLNNLEYAQMGYSAQQASVVMLKNSGNVIAQAQEDKKTVYIPMEINTGSVTDAIGNDTLAAHKAGNWSLIGYENMTFDGALAYSFDPQLAAQYFDVVTDTLNPDADLNNITETDIVRRTDFKGVDFALISVSAPLNGNGGYYADLVDLDGSDGVIDNGYYPISLTFSDYFADPAVVREYPIGLDPNEEIEWIKAGGERGRSRYYGGKITTSSSLADLALIQITRSTIGDLPLVVYVSATNPFCVYEFESIADGIVLGLGISSNAALDVISGQYEPKGLLPMQLPADMATVETQLEDVPFDMECHVDSEGNTYGFAFGLDWTGIIKDARTDTYRP